MGENEAERWSSYEPTCISGRIHYILLDSQSIMHIITFNYLLRVLGIPGCCCIVWYDVGGVWLLNDLRRNGGTAVNNSTGFSLLCLDYTRIKI